MKTTHGMIGFGKTEDRQDNDYYPTPPYVTFALTKHVDVKGKRVLEPAAGRGWMARELAACGADVIASDLYEYPNPLYSIETGIDFLDNAYNPAYYDFMITNPPYGRGLAEEFVRKCLDYECTTNVAILSRLTFMESQGRLKLFQEHPPAMVLPFSKRFSCMEDKFLVDPFGGMMAYAWYVWKRGDINTSIKWIDSQAVYDEWRALRSK